MTRVRNRKRHAIWGVAVIMMMAAAFTFGGVGTAGSQVDDPIDLTAEVEASNCVPCHVRIAEARKPGLIFQHGAHLMISCTGCHYRPAHEAGKTYTPPMESCFNCHGVEHGPQGPLATGECEDCHTPSFELRPRSHVKDWEGEPHAERAKKDVNQCMMCHDAPKDCDECHKAEGLDVGPMPKAYQTILPERAKRPSVKAYPQEPTSMGQCIHCHPDIDDFIPGRVIFEHAEHLRRNYDCTVCHPKFGHDRVAGVRRPDMLSCYRCHGLTHAEAGLVATEDCYACHPKEFELKPPDHTKRFEAGEHGKRADSDGAYCAMCHQPDFCVECHMGRKILANGRRSQKVVPADHKVAEWLSQHGPLFLAQKGSCASCHDSPSCKECHQTVMPHPADWVKGHAEAEDMEDDCNVCHTDRNKCQNCHHDKVKREELVEENCTPCHDEMSYRPAVEIKHKGYAEHAVHFDVAEKDRNNGKPYKCYDCHVSFGTSEAAKAAEKLQGHDLRLCYDCHGALDYRKAEIAPWAGAALCRRCHADINI